MTKSEDVEAVDCLELKARAQARIYARIQGLSHEEEIEYFRRAVDAGSLGAWWNELGRRARVVREKPPGYGRDPS